jgi:hypothetical protein
MVLRMACPWIAGPLPLREDSSNVEFAGVLVSRQSMVGRQNFMQSPRGPPNVRVNPAAVIGELEASYSVSLFGCPSSNSIEQSAVSRYRRGFTPRSNRT